MKRLLAAFLIAFSLPALAATQLTLTCKPTKRSDDSIMTAADVATYSFTGPGIVSAPQATGIYVLPIAKGQTIKAGTVFGCSLTDLFNQASPAAVAPLTVDAANTPAKPLAPTVGITVQ